MPPEFSETESISELIPSNIDFSLSDVDNIVKTHDSQILNVDKDVGSKNSSQIIPLQGSLTSENLSLHEPSREISLHCVSNVADDIRNESPIPLLLSSDMSKESTSHKSKSQTLKETTECSDHPGSPKEFLQSQYSDSLNEEFSHGADDLSHKEDVERVAIESDRNKSSVEQNIEDKSKSLQSSKNLDSLGEDINNLLDSLTQDLQEEESASKTNFENKDVSKESLKPDDLEEINTPEKGDQTSNSSSEEIIKLDIRGQGIPRFSFPTSKIIFGLPPEGVPLLEPSIDQIPVFENLLSPLLVSAEQLINIDNDFDDREEINVKESPEEQTSLLSNKLEQSDLLVEEMLIQDSKQTDDSPVDVEHEHASLRTQTKSLAPEETMSFSTLSTDYKTICEEYHAKV